MRRASYGTRYCYPANRNDTDTDAKREGWEWNYGSAGSNDPIGEIGDVAPFRMEQ